MGFPVLGEAVLLTGSGVDPDTTCALEGCLTDPRSRWYHARARTRWNDRVLVKTIPNKGVGAKKCLLTVVFISTRCFPRSAKICRQNGLTT